MSASDVIELEQENARLAVALGDAYAVLGKLQAQYDALKHELDWFKRQLFGSKSEKRLDMDDEAQLNLLAGLGVKEPPSRDDVPTQTVVSRISSWNPRGNWLVCSVDGLPGMTEQSGSRSEPSPFP